MNLLCDMDIRKKTLELISNQNVRLLFHYMAIQQNTYEELEIYFQHSNIFIICFINFSDLVHTTESLRSTKLSAGKIEKECSNFDVVLEPYREENARLTRENNELHLEVLKLKEQFEEQVKGNAIFLKKTFRLTFCSLSLLPVFN